jgi:hypothetical protein
MITDASAACECKNRPGTPDPVIAELEGLLPLDVLGFESLVARDDFKGDLLTFVQRLEAGTDNGRVMYKDVLTGFLGDETKPLFIVEPLYFATSHTFLLILSAETLLPLQKQTDTTERSSVCPW